jgi:hypothetical protein
MAAQPLRHEESRPGKARPESRPDEKRPEEKHPGVKHKDVLLPQTPEASPHDDGTMYNPFADAFKKMGLK